mmetsp:Transcript_29480/g.55808  ORF Transcript_29480/g.55808 Transcript_29480/m.55808 type:complete len:197 (-) Transcript_29480:119-709(-)
MKIPVTLALFFVGQCHTTHAVNAATRKGNLRTDAQLTQRKRKRLLKGKPTSDPRAKKITEIGQSKGLGSKPGKVADAEKSASAPKPTALREFVRIDAKAEKNPKSKAAKATGAGISDCRRRRHLDSKANNSKDTGNSEVEISPCMEDAVFVTSTKEERAENGDVSSDDIALTIEDSTGGSMSMRMLFDEETEFGRN